MVERKVYPYALLTVLLSALLICLLGLAKCAVNPASKEMEFMVVSADEEFRMGQKVDREVREKMGIYLELPELRTLVKQVGENLGRNSDRPDLIYRIEIVDAPDFNAFALPGGFVYVHRGLLASLNSVDELASVLGHEIAHVAARHSAAQISKARLMDMGLLGLAIATGGGSQYYSPFISIGSALAFNKFSRDDEREADHFGTIYMARAGYNPEASINVMKQIQRLQTSEPSTLETWFMTHPPGSERIKNLNHEMEKIGFERPLILKRPIRRNQYVAMLDGLAVGEWNGQELISGDRYYNKAHLMSIEIPEGWHARINNKAYISVFIDPKREFYALLDVQPLRIRQSTEAYFRDFDRRVINLGLRRAAELRSGKALKHGALRGIYKGDAQGLGSILAEGMAFVRGTSGYSLLGFGRERAFGTLQPLVESMMNSVRFMSQKEVSKLGPPRLMVHEVARGETWASITGKYFGSSRGIQKLAEYNGLKGSVDPPPGLLLKIPPSLRLR